MLAKGGTSVFISLLSNIKKTVFRKSMVSTRFLSSFWASLMILALFYGFNAPNMAPIVPINEKTPVAVNTIAGKATLVQDAEILPAQLTDVVDEGWSDAITIASNARSSTINAIAQSSMIQPAAQDTSPPAIDHPWDMTYNETTTGHTITWHPSDEFPDSYAIYRQGTSIDSGSWSGGSISINVDGEAIGSYNYTIEVSDTSNNAAQDTVGVKVVGTGNYPYSGSGDWSITQPTVVEHEAITLNGDLLIQSGGELVFRNVTLALNCAWKGQHMINVVTGGCLTIEVNSTLSAVDPQFPYYLHANPLSIIQMRNSTIRYAGYSQISYPNTRSGLWINTNDAQILNCTIQDNYVGIHLYEAPRCHIFGNRIVHSGGIILEEYSTSYSNVIGNTVSGGGIYLTKAANTNVSRNTVTNSDAGISLMLSASSAVTNNILTNISGAGINVGSSGGTLVSGNRVTNTLYEGVSLHNSGGSRVLGNNATNTGRCGIELDDCYGSVVSANAVLNSSQAGINLYMSDRSTVSGNNVTASSLGIRLQRSGNSNVSRNTVTNSTSTGIFLQLSPDSTVHNNVVKKSGPGRKGIGLEDSESTIVSNNTINDNPLWLYRSKSCIITNNTISNSEANGILVEQLTTHCTLTKNSIFHANLTGIELTFDSDHTTISDNTVIESNHAGIGLRSSDYATVSGNVVDLSGDIGIFLYSSQYSNITQNNVTNTGNSHGMDLSIDRCNIFANIVTNTENSHGIYLEGTRHCDIFANIVTNSGSDHSGIYLVADSYDCTLWRNLLASNPGGNANDEANDDYGNQWDNGTHGNWWDDYMGADANGDGIGDIRYDVPGEGGAQDFYPLMDWNGYHHPASGRLPKTSRTSETAPGMTVLMLLGSLMILTILARRNSSP